MTKKLKSGRGCVVLSRWAGLLVVAAAAGGCGGARAPGEEAQAVSAATCEQPGQELRLYARGGIGLYRADRHPDGRWDPMTLLVPISGTLVQASAAGSTGYPFSFDGRAGGVLLADAPGSSLPAIVSLPPLPVVGGPPFLVGAEVADGKDGTREICATSLQGRLLHATADAERGSGSWQDIEAEAGALSSRSTVSCAEAGGALHACAVDAAGLVRHSVRRDGQWQPWTTLAGQTVERVRCRGRGEVLAVLAQGASGAFYTEGSDDFAAWEALADALDDARAGNLRELAVVGGRVHAVGGDGSGVWHTVRHHDGRWAPLADLRAVIADYPAEATTVAVAAIQR
jgi:hypothetical protein